MSATKKESPKNAMRRAFIELAEGEREVCARIALEVARRRHLADDEHGASTARQIAKFIREDAFPEVRETCAVELKRNRCPLPPLLLLEGQGDSASEQVLKDREVP